MDLEKAKEIVGDLSEAMEKSAREKGWDVDFAEDFDKEEPATPVVKILRKSTVGDSLQVEKLAWAEYGPKQKHDPTPQQIMVAKLATMCTFDGKQLPCIDIERLGEDFFMHIFVKLSKSPESPKNK